MKTGYLALLVILGGTGACSKTTADRSQSQGADRGQAVAADTAAPDRQDTASHVDQERRADGTGPAIVTITGVFLEPTIASTCGIPLSPKAYFEFDAASLDTSDKLTLRDVATCLTTGPLAGRKIEVIGHADPRGPDEYNKQLGRSRAESVQEYLQKQGVPQANLVVRSMGEQRAEETDPIGWPHDRRVDLRLLPADGGATGNGAPNKQ